MDRWRARHGVWEDTVYTVVKRLVFDSRWWVFCAAVNLFIILRSGIGGMPNLNTSRVLATDPFTAANLPPGAQYVMSSWLVPFMGWALRMTSPHKFFVLCLVINCVMAAALSWLLFLRLDGRSARIALILYASLPISSTPWFWVGPDGLTLLLMILALAFADRWLLVGLLGVLLGMQHFEQGATAIGALIVSRILGGRVAWTGRYGLRFCLVWLGGAVAGRALLTLIFTVANAQPATDRVKVVLAEWPKMIIDFFMGGPLFLLASLGAGWLAVALYLWYTRQWRSLMVPLALLMGLTMIAYDESRVFGITAFPLLAVSLLLNADFLDKISTRALLYLVAATLVTPWVWVWSGVGYHSSLTYDILLVARKFGLAATWMDPYLAVPITG